MPQCNYRKCKAELAMRTKRQEFCNGRCRVKENKLRAKERNGASVPTTHTTTLDATARGTAPSIPFAVPTDLATAVFFGVWSLLALLKLASTPVGNVAEQLTMLHLNLTSHRGHPVVDFIYRTIEEATADYIRILKAPWYGRTARLLGSAIGFDVRARIDGTHEEVCLNKGDFEPRWPAVQTPEEPDNLENEWPFVDPKAAKIDVCLAVLAICRRINPTRLPSDLRRGAIVRQIAAELSQPIDNTLSAVEMAMDDGLIETDEPGNAMEQQWFVTTKGVTLGTVDPEHFDQWPHVDPQQARRDVCLALFDLVEPTAEMTVTVERLAVRLGRTTTATLAAIEHAGERQLVERHSFGPGCQGGERTVYTLSPKGYAFVTSKAECPENDEPLPATDNDGSRVFDMRDAPAADEDDADQRRLEQERREETGERNATPYPRESFLVEKVDIVHRSRPLENLCPCCELPMAEDGEICETCTQWAGAILASVRAAMGKTVRAKEIVAQYPHMAKTALFATVAGAWLAAKGDISFDDEDETVVAYFDPIMRKASDLGPPPVFTEDPRAEEPQEETAEPPHPTPKPEFCRKHWEVRLSSSGTCRECRGQKAQDNRDKKKAERDAKLCVCGHRRDAHKHSERCTDPSCPCSKFGTRWVRKQQDPTTKAHTMRLRDTTLYVCGKPVTEHAIQAELGADDCKRCVAFRFNDGTEGARYDEEATQ